MDDAIVIYFIEFSCVFILIFNYSFNTIGILLCRNIKIAFHTRKNINPCTQWQVHSPYFGTSSYACVIHHPL